MEGCSNLAILNLDDPRVLITLFLLLLLWMNAVKLDLQKLKLFTYALIMKLSEIMQVNRMEIYVKKEEMFYC